MTFDGKIVVFDTETTGIDTEQARVVEFGAVIYEGGKEVDSFRALINPECPIPKEASEVHGIWDKDVVNERTFKENALEFSRFFGGDHILSGYNILSYDIPLMNNEFKRAEVDLTIGDERIIDPIVFFRYHYRHLRSRTLGSAAEEFGIDLRDAHTAVADARATGQLLFKLIDNGIIPKDIQEAFELQRKFKEALDDEWSAYSYWLYRDRTEGHLRVGAGKHCGSLVEEVPSSYFSYILSVADDLPCEVRKVFSEACGA